MNKRDLIAALHEELGDEWTKQDVTEALEAFQSVVTTTIKKGEPVTITGFCKFSRVDRKARMGRNPATGESIKIKAKKSVRITPLKALKDAVLGAKK